MLSPVRSWAGIGTVLLLALVSPASADSAAPQHVNLLATLADSAVTESSGLAASRFQPGILWTHNDSGGEPVLFAKDGADALFIADTGNNGGARDDFVIYRVAEPKVSAAETSETAPRKATAPVERVPFVYPDGTHDAEALLVHPATGEVLIVTKTLFGAAEVFTLPAPLPADQPVTVIPAGTLDLPGFPGRRRMVTGGAVSPGGDQIVIRTYGAAFTWTVAPETSLAESIHEKPEQISMPAMPQGEAISYDASGTHLILTSEGSPCPLYEAAIPRESSEEAAVSRPLRVQGWQGDGDARNLATTAGIPRGRGQRRSPRRLAARRRSRLVRRRSGRAGG